VALHGRHVDITKGRETTGVAIMTEKPSLLFYIPHLALTFIYCNYTIVVTELTDLRVR
jgi:hypothetical protein